MSARAPELSEEMPERKLKCTPYVNPLGGCRVRRDEPIGQRPAVRQQDKMLDGHSRLCVLYKLGEARSSMRY